MDLATSQVKLKDSTRYFFKIPPSKTTVSLKSKTETNKDAQGRFSRRPHELLTIFRNNLNNKTGLIEVVHGFIAYDENFRNYCGLFPPC